MHIRKSFQHRLADLNVPVDSYSSISGYGLYHM